MLHHAQKCLFISWLLRLRHLVSFRARPNSNLNASSTLCSWGVSNHLFQPALKLLSNFKRFTVSFILCSGQFNIRSAILLQNLTISSANWTLDSSRTALSTENSKKEKMASTLKDDSFSSYSFGFTSSSTWGSPCTLLEYLEP